LLTGICNKRDEKEKKDKKELCFPTKKKFYAKKKEKGFPESESER